MGPEHLPAKKKKYNNLLETQELLSVGAEELYTPVAEKKQGRKVAL